MSEMLGNQYFMARNYSEAVKELEPCLIEDQTNKGIKRKLIVCYTQTGKVQKAIDMFEDLIIQDIEFIITADAIKDDCPCPDLVVKIEKSRSINYKSLDYFLILGIIWLYCDVQKSLEYFYEAQNLERNDRINSIIEKIEEYLNITNSTKSIN